MELSDTPKEQNKKEASTEVRQHRQCPGHSSQNKVLSYFEIRGPRAMSRKWYQYMAWETCLKKIRAKV